MAEKELRLGYVRGRDGIDGKNGVDGKSPYQVAVEEGYTGTEEQLYAALASLIGAPFLPTAGGTMTGPLNMSGQKISFLGTPVASTDAVTKDYVDKAEEALSRSIDGKTSKTPPAASGNLAALDEEGNLTDSGKKASDFTGKRVCRFVVGTSTAGWTAADCDYLCDGTDDQVEINAAIQALPAGGGEILVLDGTYSMDQPVLLNRAAVTLRGCGAAAKFIQSYKENSPGNALIRISADNVGLRDLSVDCKYSTYFGYPCAVSVLSGALARLEAVSVSDCVMGFSVSSGAEQTRLLNCDCAQGKNSSFSGQSVLISGCHLGIATLNGSGGKIVGSQFHEGDTYNAALTIAIGSKNTICGNYIYSSYATVDFGAGSSFNVFSGNVVSGDSPSDSGTENVLANNVVTAG